MDRSMILLSLLVLIASVVNISFAAHQDCLEIPSESNFQPEDVEGIWYPAEIVLHRNDSKIYGVPVTSQCPVVTITRNKRILTMVWNATDGDVKFSFSQKGSNRLAQWQANGDQTGSFVDEQYKHFGGVVKVSKLNSKYFFLSFCSSKFKLLSTVAFTRDENMPREEFQETMAILYSRNLKRATEIQVRPCDGVSPSSQAVVSLCLLLILTSCALHACRLGIDR